MIWVPAPGEGGWADQAEVQAFCDGLQARLSEDGDDGAEYHVALRFDVERSRCPQVEIREHGLSKPVNFSADFFQSVFPRRCELGQALQGLFGTGPASAGGAPAAVARFEDALACR